MKFGELPLPGRIYMLAIIGAGTIASMSSLTPETFARPLLLLTFVAASIAVHSHKFTSPVGSAATSVSLGFAVTFASLLVLGSSPTVWTIVAGGWTQTTLNTKTTNAWYKRLFTLAALVLSVQATAYTLHLTGGENLDGAADIVIPSIAAS